MNRRYESDVLIGDKEAEVITATDAKATFTEKEKIDAEISVLIDNCVEGKEKETYDKMNKIFDKYDKYSTLKSELETKLIKLIEITSYKYEKADRIQKKTKGDATEMHKLGSTMRALNNLKEYFYF